MSSTARIYCEFSSPALRELAVDILRSHGFSCEPEGPDAFVVSGPKALVEPFIYEVIQPLAICVAWGKAIGADA